MRPDRRRTSTKNRARRPRLPMLLGAFAIVLWHQAAVAQVVADDCQLAIAAVEQRNRLPSRLLTAIAIVESGRRNPANGTVAPWPWTINVQGIGHAYPSKAEAIAAVQMFQGQGIRSIDVGCMQINLQHHPAAFASLDEAFDPAINVAYGALFLGLLYRQFDNWPQANGAYHSQTPEIGAPYASRVRANWVLGAQFFPDQPAPGPGRTAPRSDLLIDEDRLQAPALSMALRQAAEDVARLDVRFGTARGRSAGQRPWRTADGTR